MKISNKTVEMCSCGILFVMGGLSFFHAKKRIEEYFNEMQLSISYAIKNSIEEAMKEKKSEEEYDILHIKCHLKNKCQKMLEDIDILDICNQNPLLIQTSSNISTCLHEMLKAKKSYAIIQTSHAKGILDMTDITVQLLKTQILDGIPEISSCLRKFVYVNANADISEIFSHLAMGARYIALYDDKLDKLYGAISQGDIIRYIFPKLNSNLYDLKLKNCSHFMKHILTISKTETARKAFNIMVDNNITSLPIVDDENSMISVISLTDIKYLSQFNTPELQQQLDLNVLVFLSSAREFLANELGFILPSVHDVIYCNLNDSLKICIDKILRYNIHHVYIYDSANTICGIVSFVDILTPSGIS